MSQIEPIELPQTITSLEDISAYKDSLHKQIEQEEERIANKWNDLFHKEETMPQGSEVRKDAEFRYNYVRWNDARLETLPQISRRGFHIGKNKKEAQVSPTLHS